MGAVRHGSAGGERDTPPRQRRSRIHDTRLLLTALGRTDRGQEWWRAILDARREISEARDSSLFFLFSFLFHSFYDGSSHVEEF